MAKPMHGLFPESSLLTIKIMLQNDKELKFVIEKDVNWMIKHLEKLENRIKRYSQYNAVCTLTKQSWELFNKPSGEGFSCPDRSFLTCISWLCFIALGKCKNVPMILLKKNEWSQWTDKMWHFISEIINPQNTHCVGLINPFVQNLDSLASEFSDYLNLKGQKQENYLQDLSTLTPDEKINIFQTLTYASDLKIKNIGIVETQYSGECYVISARSLRLVKAFAETLNDKSHLNDFIKNKLNFSSSLEFHQACWLVFALFNKGKGTIDIDELSDLLRDCVTSMDVDKEESLNKSVINIIESLSINIDNIKNSYEVFKNNLIAQKTLLQKDNPFYAKPVYKYISSGKTKYICPSPYILLAHMGQDFSSRFYHYNKEIFGKISGNAYEKYINDFIKHYKDIKKFISFNLDNKEERAKVFKENNDELSTADFIIETDNYIFIIECKNSIGVRDPFYKEHSPEEPHPLLSSWNRMGKAIDQCDSTINQLSSHTKKVFSLVVVNETILTEVVPFGMFLHYSECFKKSNIKWGEFSIMSLPLFEYLINSGSLEIFAQNCAANANHPFDSADAVSIFESIKEKLNIMYSPSNYTLDLSFWEVQRNHLIEV